MASSRQVIPALILVLLFPACRGSGGDDYSPAPRLLMATTTSTANTGLLDELLPSFEEVTGIRVDFVAVGSGAALKLGESGDVDLILSHALDAEIDFVRAGFGEARVPIMYNDFVVVGPSSDPATVANAGSAVEAFRRIAESASPFISRGDNSGTHMKEVAIWEEADVAPSAPWYIDAGQGMGACLLMAEEKSAYVLSDRGTYLTRAADLEIEVLFDGDTLLYNPYAAIAVPPGRRPAGNYEGAQALIEWLTSADGQNRISQFRICGEPLFYPHPADRRKN
ncbi:MAG: substrate-binding domain-containing protein [Candidatus Eisenbacteria bacterium]